MILENIKIALVSMINNKLRTLLSLLGIIIGVGSVIAILNLGKSASSSMTDSMGQTGMNIVSLYVTPSDADSKIFTKEFAREIKRNVKEIKDIFPVMQAQTRVRYLQEFKYSTIQGVTSEYFEANESTIAYGEYFTAQDNLQNNQKVVLGSSIAEDLFPAGNAVGETISIFRNQAKPYLIVGVLEQQDSIFSSNLNDTIFLPINTFTSRFSNRNVVDSYIIQTKSGGNALELEEKVDAYLKAKISDDNYVLFSSATIVEMANQINGTFSIFLAAIAAISLLVGGIGIMNIMLVSVAERTREIGIRKALGASPAVIKGQFLCEAITITSLGGILGIVLGIFISYSVVKMVGWPLQFNYTAVILSLGFSMFVGVFFGWYPANKAAKLDPIEALSYE